MPGLGGGRPPGKTLADATMNRTRSKHSAVDGQTLLERRPGWDGQALVPRVRVFPMLSLLRSEQNKFLLFLRPAVHAELLAEPAEIPSL